MSDDAVLVHPMSMAQLVRALANAGASTEVLILVVNEIEARELARVDPYIERKAKDALRAAEYRRRAGGTIPEELRQAVYERDGFKSVYCGSEFSLTCDHVLAVSKNGRTTFENLATACQSCNSSKRDHLLEEWLRAK